MSVREVERAQAELSPRDDLSEYVGEWVALRGGHVVAHDIDPARLRENPDVRPGDVIVPISEPDGGYFF